MERGVWGERCSLGSRQGAVGQGQPGTVPQPLGVLRGPHTGVGSPEGKGAPAMGACWKIPPRQDRPVSLCLSWQNSIPSWGRSERGGLSRARVKGDAWTCPEARPGGTCPSQEVLVGGRNRGQDWSFN